MSNKKRISMPRGIMRRFKASESILQYMLQGVLAVLAVFISVACMTGDAFADDSEEADTEIVIDYQSGYQPIVYGIEDGLVSTSVNAIEQTPDGYIWVGTYSGLYRYDGVEFKLTKLSSKIANVMSLYVDINGNLWIGTNDSGVFCYNIKTKEVTEYCDAQVLSALSIRSINGDENGNVYVGTVGYLAKISPDGNVKLFDDNTDTMGTRSLAVASDNRMVGVTGTGNLYIIDNDVVYLAPECETEGVSYLTAGCNGNDIYVGTSSDSIFHLILYTDNTVEHEMELSIGELKYYNCIRYSPESNGYFVCAENGMAFLYNGGGVDFFEYDNFQNSIGDVLLDYQGNVWFTSSKQGILELSKNIFADLFKRSVIDPTVVNCLYLREDELYIGTDTGLVIMDINSHIVEEYSFVEDFADVRIRHITEDLNGNIWVSTYGKEGLYKIEKDWQVRTFNETNATTLGGRFRIALALSDGTVVAASNEGLNYIKNNRVVYTLGEENGLIAPQFLTMIELDDGSIMAGSDGNGIYIIKDHEVVKNIGIEEGLGSLVVLKIIECPEGFIYVTSNALYYQTGDTIRKLENFPYTNNYDVFITTTGDAWVLSSAGIYIVKLEDLLADGEYSYVLLDYSRGFNTALTANAWNLYREDDESMLLCCTDGVRSVTIEGYNSLNQDNYYIGLNSIVAGNKEITPNDAGKYIIPAGAKKVQISVAVLNYVLSNPLIHVYFEGLEDDGTEMYQKDLHAIDYTNLPYGKYKLHIEVLDTSGKSVLREAVYQVEKKAYFYELLAVRIFLVALAVAFAGFLVWRIMHITIVSRQYDQIREAKEEAERANSAKSRFLANMSHEIRTPINTIMGMDEMIIREDRTQNVEEYSHTVVSYAGSIKRASESLLSLVNDILDLSKVESGKMNLVEEEYDTKDLIRSVSTMIKVRANEKDLVFNQEIDPDLPTRLYADQGKIKQIVLNLLTNAVKYTPEGSFTLKIEATKNDGEYCNILYSVSDTGIGVKPEDMDKLFSAFERLDEKKNSGIQGTGLGLDISRQFAELMGSALMVESEYGKGSTFYFEVKQKIIDTTPIGEFNDDTGDDEGAYIPLFVAPKAKVLVVDDNDMNLQVIKGLLKITQVQIETAMSGKECLEKLSDNAEYSASGAKSCYDIVFLDHMMPEMDGIETVHEIRKFFSTLPVIALTANAATSGEAFYVNEGFQGYLAKPIDSRKLEATIKKYLPENLVLDPREHMDMIQSALREDLSETEKALLDTITNVIGIDASEGVKNCGSKKSFLSTLETFYNTLTEKSAEIKEAYDNEDWNFYTIKVHALKSSARIIGASELSSLALHLEDAGKDGNIEYIRANNDKMMEKYLEYIPRLEEVFKHGDEGKEPIDSGMLSDAYEALGEFVPMMDYDSAEMVIVSLKDYALPEEDAKRMTKLETLLKQLKWEEMSEILKEIK